MIDPEMLDNPAYALTGKTLNGKWLVTERIDKKPNGTGGFFSVCYEVVNGEQTAFLKALNFKAFLSSNQNKPFIDVLTDYTNTYQYEKRLLERCKNNRLSKVATIIDEGEADLSGFTFPKVPFMIFEMADGDLRKQLLTLSNGLDIAWKLRSLHNIAVGMKQLSGVRISHQDLKPSNVLIYEGGEISKIGDLGRSLCQDIVAPHENGVFTGDASYAPPELFYGYRESDWFKRTNQIDLYMFGNLCCFYFTSVTMTTLVLNGIDPSFHYMTWRGSYGDVKHYLFGAHKNAIDILKKQFKEIPVLLDLVDLIRDCTMPDPALRGIFKGKNNIGNKLPFEPIISKMNLLAAKAEMLNI